MKMRSLTTLVFFFFISLTLVFNGGLASEDSDISTSKQAESDIIHPDWLVGPWGRHRIIPHPHPHPHPHPYPRRPIPGYGRALPPLPAHKFPPLPWWAHKPPSPASSSGRAATFEEVEVINTEEDDDDYQLDWLYGPHPRHGYYPHPRYNPNPRYYPRPGYYPRPYPYPHPGVPRYPVPGWGAHPPKPAH